MPGLVPGIHVLLWLREGSRGWPGHRRAEATLSFGRLCPAMLIISCDPPALAKIKRPRPAGGPGGALTSGAPLRQAGQFVQMAKAALLDQLNDAPGAWFDQDGAAIHHGVAIGRDGKALRHVVNGDAGRRQHAADDHAIRYRVIRHPLANDVFTVSST